jgi:hypothetical protein
MEYPLLISEWGQFTCHATHKENLGDGIDEHRCPYFDTPKEVAAWVSEHETN